MNSSSLFQDQKKDFEAGIFGPNIPTLNYCSNVYHCFGSQKCVSFSLVFFLLFLFLHELTFCIKTIDSCWFRSKPNHARNDFNLAISKLQYIYIYSFAVNLGGFHKLANIIMYLSSAALFKCLIGCDDDDDDDDIRANILSSGVGLLCFFFASSLLLFFFRIGFRVLRRRNNERDLN